MHGLDSIRVRRLLVGEREICTEAAVSNRAMELDVVEEIVMEYLDEEILRKREKLKSQRYTTLEGGFYIQGKIINFVRSDILNTMSIYLPNNMQDMPDEYAQIKYPSVFRPSKILTTIDLSINFGFSMLWYEFHVKQIDKIADRMMRAIQRSNPNYRFDGSENIKELSGTFFSFRSHAMDIDLFNMMLLVPIKNEILFCTFNCPYPTYKEWKQVVKLMWESIKIKKENYVL